MYLFTVILPVYYLVVVHIVEVAYLLNSFVYVIEIPFFILLVDTVDGQAYFGQFLFINS